MQQGYFSKGKELLKILLNNGFEAYFVGEVVRNILINTDYKRIDICTNATTFEVKRLLIGQNATMFETNIYDISDSMIKVVYFDYAFYFQSYQALENNNDDNRSVLTRHYSKVLIDHLSSRNFTINAIALSYNEKATDAVNGKADIDKKIIRTNGNPKLRFTNYPADMLEAFKIVSEIKFNIHKNTYNAIKKKAKLLQNLDKQLIFDYLNDILTGPYSKKALSYMIGANVHKYIPSLSKGLHLAQKLGPKANINIEELLLLSFIINEEIDEAYIEKVANIEIFKKIFNVAITNKKGMYDKLTLFTNGLDVCVEANILNNMLAKDKLRTKAIKKEYDALPIKHVCDLKFKGDSILRITDLTDTAVVAEIMDEVIFAILNGDITNDYNDIQSFVLKSLSSKGIYYDINRTEADLKEKIFRNEDEVINDVIASAYEKNNSNLNDEEKNINDQISSNYESNDSDDYTARRLRILEERLNEQDRMLQEKSDQIKEMENQKILEITDKVVNNTKEFINSDAVVHSVISDLNDFEIAYRSFIVDYIEKDKDK